MIITISGTPGTGKTEIAKELSKITDYDIISIAELLKKGKLNSTYWNWSKS